MHCSTCQLGLYFLFSVSVSPDACAAHVGTRSFLAPGVGNAEAEKQLSVGWAPTSHGAFSLLADFSFHKTHVFSPGVQEGRGFLIQFYKNVLSCMIVGTVL